jgi:hypothetical protein
MAAPKSNKPARRRATPAAAPRPSTASRALNAFSFGALVIAAGAALYEGYRRFSRRDGAEHPAPDLALDAPRPGSDGERAPVAFRPDPTASVSAGERDSFRPALVEP